MRPRRCSHSSSPWSPPTSRATGTRSGRRSQTTTRPTRKRAVAADLVAAMTTLGHETFAVAGHDRGGRVAYRMALDSPSAVTRLAVLDIVPTAEVWSRADALFAMGYWHWPFLAQPAPLPERLILGDPDGFWLAAERIGLGVAPGRYPQAVLDTYRAQLDDPEIVTAICEDYRAGATIDRELDEADRGRRTIACPVLALWGANGALPRLLRGPAGAVAALRARRHRPRRTWRLAFPGGGRAGGGRGRVGQVFCLDIANRARSDSPRDSWVAQIRTFRSNASKELPRMTDAKRPTTTDSGIPATSDEFSATVGPAGPIPLHDHYLVQKMQHFNRERVPERVVHAKGGGAHGFFEVTEDVSQYTKAKFLAAGSAHPGVPALLDRRRRAGLPGHGARPARVRDQDLHRGGQPRPRRQQHAGVLRPRPHEVPGLHPLAEAPARHRTAQQRHAVGLLDAVARERPPGDGPDVGPRHAAHLAPP